MTTVARRAFAALTLLAAPTVGFAQDPAKADYDEALSKLQADFERRLAELEKKVAAAPAAKPAEKAEKKWYDKLSLKGYTQVRFTTLFNKDITPDLSVPQDPFVSETETINIRRGRFTFSGDLSERVSMYGQMDYYGSVGGAGDKGVQSRDLYADIFLDSDKEYRFRVGLSKIPFGFVNMQSSQNRAAFERADGMNSAVEGERDFGVFFYWAPKEVREIYKELVKSGLKGSGDYGVVGVGAYSGQGPNRSDLNGEAHWVARLAHPFKLDNGQYLEFGVAGYTGDYVVSTSALAQNGGAAPTVKADGVDDERVALTAVMYPQPFGIEAEWNWGRGPQLASNFASIGVESLQGGYIQFNYSTNTSHGNVFPFLRWNYYDGGRKFGRNAPWDEINELDLGFEWSPWPELELSMMYTHTFQRTNTAVAPYDKAEGEDRLGFQLQWNY